MRTNRIDPIISEVRTIRDRYAARFDYDVAAIFRDLRTRQETSERVYVHYPARRVELGPESDDSARRKRVTNTAPDTSRPQATS